jgi:hypothetical protein
MSADDIAREAERLKKSTYGNYLMQMLEQTPKTTA